MTNIKILYAEDNLTDQMALTRNIKKNKLNYDVTFANSSKKVLSILEETTDFDIVFLDHELGDGTAFELIQKIPKTIPFVIITGTNDVEIAVHAMKSGASDFLSKDVDGNYLKLIPITIASVIKSQEIKNELDEHKSNLEKLISERTEELKLEVTERKLAQERWNFALESAQTGVWDWEIQTGKCFFSERWKEIFGYSKDDVFDHVDEFSNRIHPDHKEQALKNLSEHLEGKVPFHKNDLQVKCKDGTYKWVQVRGKVIQYSNIPLRMIGTCEDISNKKATEAYIWKQANYDSLTKLPNRRMFYSKLEHELQKVTREQYEIGLLTLDLDKFKDINDTLGHDYGDLLLQKVAKRLVQCVRKSDTVARLGGDEFSIILTHFKNNTHIANIANNIISSLEKSFDLNGDVVYISASIGITIAPDDSLQIDELIKNADQAMYKAKDNGRNGFHFFTQSLHDAAQHRMTITKDLRSALINNEFEAYYQPVVDLKTGEIYKAESLIRWNHPTRGLVPPINFIHIAEETGIINEIGDWMLQESFKRAQQWSKSHHKDFQVSVNVSPIQFKTDTDSMITKLQKLLENCKLDGKNIVLEITESLLLNIDDNITDKLNWLSDAGIEVAMDDFGTGYSSLSYLKKFHIDYLKIDKIFVDNIVHDKNDLALCEAIIVMAHTLGLKVIAEGVETKEQKDILLQMDCDFYQGYFYSKPVPAESFEKLLIESRE